jgi:hypothetical protein
VSLDAATVLEAAAGGIFVPDDATRVDGDGYVIVRYQPDFVYDTSVYRVESDRPAADLVDEVSAQARAWGRETIWWSGLHDATQPSTLEPLLRDRGAELVDRVAVLALDLRARRPSLDAPPDVEIVRPSTVQHILDKQTIQDEAFGPTPRITSPEVRLAREVRDRESGKGESVIVYADGEPAAFGGTGYEDGVARLHGGSTRTALRGRGAYRASLDARLQAAADVGCWLALVKGRLDTSAPILRRAGFVEYGEERVYRVAVPLADVRSAL